MSSDIRIGLIADIHCELTNLIRALDLLRENEVSGVVCAGDLVEKGTAQQGDAVIHLLRTLRIPCVGGNHDFDVAENQKWLRENGDPNNPNLALRLYRNETLEFLAALPLTRTFQAAGRRMMLAHGAPWSPGTYIYYNATPEVYLRVRQAANADVLIVGHTHQPMHVQFDGFHVVNPGSVCGGVTTGTQTCAILTLPSCQLEVYDLNDGHLVLDYPHLQLSIA